MAAIPINEEVGMHSHMVAERAIHTLLHCEQARDIGYTVSLPVQVCSPSVFRLCCLSADTRNTYSVSESAHKPSGQGGVPQKL